MFSKNEMRKSWRSRIGFCLILLSILSIGALGQDITSGTIQGTVLDEQGAAIPGATVEGRNIATNFTRTFISDSDGRFILLSLPPGRYLLSVTKEGFAKTNQENVDLTVGRTLSLTLTLKVSGVSGEVTVTNTPTIDTVKTESSTTLNEAAIGNTPILGRKFEDLLTLTPGVAITQGPDGDEINFSGQRGIFNNVSLDGGDYNNGFFGEQAGGQRAAIDITLDAVKEFQVIATGANAEYGRTAGGIINVITKSGTNDLHGSLFYYLRHKALSSNTSDGKELQGFRRHQFGGTIGGPIKRDKVFYFFAVEGIRENLVRPNLSEQLGTTPCPVTTPVITNPADEALINSNPDCQRRALLNFMATSRSSNEGLPIVKKIDNVAFLGKFDWELNQSNKFSASYNFDHSKNTNQTFDVPTYGTSSNGTEGPSKINVVNANLYTTFSPTMLNEAHFTFSHENRPRSATVSNIPADTGIGFSPSFRFGNPFFLQPNVDEVFWRTQVRDSVSVINGPHTFKFGGDWMHSVNTQVFRGFFLSRYIFGSVNGFLRYASPASTGTGFGPNAGQCPDGTWVDIVSGPPCSSGSPGSPLFLYLQAAGPSGPATDAAGASSIKNEDYALFAQDRFQIASNFTLNYGLRWEAQIFPKPTVDPSDTAYGIFLGRPEFPSDGFIPNDTSMWQPRVGFAWDIANNSRSVLRSSFGIFAAHQNMLTQVSAITTNGVQQQTIAGVRPVWPGVFSPSAGSCTDFLGTNPFPCFSGIHVFHRDYKNPRVYTFNAAFEQEIAPDLALYFDFTFSKGRHLTRFLDYGRTGDFGIYFSQAFFHTSFGKSTYLGFTTGIRKRFSHGFQLEANYVLSRDKDDDSNERDPFTDRSIDPLDPALDYSLSDRDITHKFNLFAYFELPWKFQFTPRVQVRSAQPATPNTTVFVLVDGATNRNTIRKDNEYFTFDWRLGRVFKLGETMEFIPQIEMFNTFNNKNFINSLSVPGNQFSVTAANLFSFDGFLRQGIGDPRQIQLSARFKF